MITVALPNYASDIAWIAMESLCRQETSHEWELSIYEDSDLPLGSRWYWEYFDRLAEVGCKHIWYKYSESRVPLNQKWCSMAEDSHKDSLGIILQASDCYSEPSRIEFATEAMISGADYIHAPTRYFYNILTGEMMTYKMNGPKGVNASLSKRVMMAMPKDQEMWQSVDHWLYTNLPSDTEFLLDQSSGWWHGVNTDGFNRISLKRRNHYKNPISPYHKTLTIIDQVLPEDVIRQFAEYKKLKIMNN